MPQSPDQSATGKPLKRRRITRACDYCHQRSVRCQQVGDGPSCRNCLDFAQPCTFNRVPKKRGAPPKLTRSDDRQSDNTNQQASLAIRDGSSGSDGQSASAMAGGGEVGGSGSGSGSSAPIRDSDDSAGRFIYHGQAGALSETAGAGAGAGAGAATVARDGARDGAGAGAEFLVAPPSRILDLVDLYFEIVYPIFPFFHKPSFLQRISQQEYTQKHNKSLMAATMSVCALVAGRVRDGAVSNPRRDTVEISRTPPQAFYKRAREELSRDPTKVDLNTLRSHAILAITAIQYGNTRDMHYHIGQYHTLVAMDAFHDEAEWPPSIGIIEREERRRLFWSIYTLDIYTSIVWGGVVRGREQQYKVSYPLEIDDELITDTSPMTDTQARQIQSDSSDRPNWLYGWNFTTDLYRILEHALTRFRESKSNEGRQTAFLHDIFFRDRAENSITVTSVRDNVMQMYLGLPHCFKATPQSITYDSRKDLYGFQSANITATVQLLRMVLFSVDEGSMSLNDRCQVASEVIEAFWTIPDAYQQAISAPLLHHLGGIGFILGGSARLEDADPEEGEWLYTRLRSVLLDLARLLGRLEGLVTSAHVSERLEKQVARIDERIMAMRQQRHYNIDNTQPPVPSNGAPMSVPPQQPYAGTQLPAAAGAPTYHQAPPILNNTPIQGQMADWSNVLVFPNDMFGDFSWAINSL